jgi:dihydropteroate synthase
MYERDDDALTALLPELGRRTLIMGILNTTPDSFSDGAPRSTDEYVGIGMRLVGEGADIVDVGGESTRPGAEPVSLDEELARSVPVIRGIRAQSKIPISIDTSKAEVAREALAAGADMINDVTALRGDPDMAAVAAEAGCPLVLMHMLGTPRTMQEDPRYDDVVGDISGFLRERIRAAAAAGIEETNIIVDPGIGFGKKLQHNLEILNRLKEFAALGRPILVGPSRKSFIGMILDQPSDQRVEGTLAAVAICVMNGAWIIRVHDVRETVRAVWVAEAIMRGR